MKTIIEFTAFQALLVTSTIGFLFYSFKIDQQLINVGADISFFGNSTRLMAFGCIIVSSFIVPLATLKRFNKESDGERSKVTNTNGVGRRSKVPDTEKAE